MIPLSEHTPLGVGRHRKCYAHPDDARRCIKVIYNREHGGDKEIRRELGYYAHLSRNLVDWSAIPRYYGTVETDCGTGYVYDMITDFNGTPSITLTEFATQCRYEEDVAVLRQLLKKLKRYLLENHIVTMSLKPQNVLCQRISEAEVVPVVCDNLGESTFIPLATWSTWCCERKLERVWQRFIAQPELALALEKDAQPKDKKGLSLTSRKA